MILQSTQCSLGSEVNYSPSINFSGSDSFTYRVTDGFANSNVVPHILR